MTWIEAMHSNLDNLRSVKDWKKQIDFLNTLINEYPDSRFCIYYKQHIDLYRKKIQIARS